MTQNQKNLAAKLLGISSEEFSNHGCNDLDEGTFKDWTTAEKAEFLLAGKYWNGADLEISIEDIETIPDWMAMDILAYQLKNDKP